MDQKYVSRHLTKFHVVIYVRTVLQKLCYSYMRHARFDQMIKKKTNSITSFVVRILKIPPLNPYHQNTKV